jgi:NDP-sugar pyrophosphorylase family protein
MPAICLNVQGRVMLKPVQELAIGEGNVVEIFKRSIHNGGGFSMYADILDVGVYCCSANTLDFVQENVGVHTLGQGLLNAVVGSKGVESDFQYDAEIIGGQAKGDEGQLGSGNGSVFYTRVTSSALLLHANRELPTYMLNAQQSEKQAVWTMTSGYIKKAFSIVGTDVDVKEKVVMKLCAISDGCRVATKSKLNNSIIMQNVIIGENCTVQNSILATGCVLEDNCNINDCLISANKIVSAGTKVKNEVL